MLNLTSVRNLPYPTLIRIVKNIVLHNFPPPTTTRRHGNFAGVLLRAKKVGHQISVSFEKFDIVQALLSFFLTLFQLTV
jgi:hypothetical protein